MANDCIRERENRTSMCIMMETSYDTAMLLPIELLPYLENICNVTGNGYDNKGLRYSSKKPRFILINENTVKPELPDPAIALANIAARKAQLQEEITRLEKEEQSL
jgi:hypothetical protein